MEREANENVRITAHQKHRCCCVVIATSGTLLRCNRLLNFDNERSSEHGHAAPRSASLLPHGSERFSVSIACLVALHDLFMKSRVL